MKLLTAYAAGTAATAFISCLVWYAPLPDYAKRLLSWILPVPVILIALVLLYYGPQSSCAGEAWPDTPAGIARIFLMGALTALGGIAIVPLLKFAARRLARRSADGDTSESE